MDIDDHNEVEYFLAYKWLLKQVPSLKYFDAFLPSLILTIRQVSALLFNLRPLIVKATGKSLNCDLVL